MVVETEILPFFEWFPVALRDYLLLIAIVAAGAVLLGLLLSALWHGPVTAARLTGRALACGVNDIGGISPRRVWALTRLAVKESIRRRVLVVFAVFILILLFAGWFLARRSDHPSQLYLTFVLWSTNVLMLLLALLISALSLPADFKNKTLHTIVTKPVRPSEIVLGRILGFTVIGTGLLLVMGAISYVFVVRELSHPHQALPADLEVAERTLAEQLAGDAQQGPIKLQTTKQHGHRHSFRINPLAARSGEAEAADPMPQSGSAGTSMDLDHWHEVFYELSAGPSGQADDPKIDFQIGLPRGRLTARVPIYGKLSFKNRAGQAVEEGVNVGDMWEYRSFIEGGGQATAIWTFDGITAENFPEAQFPRGLPLEMTIEVFRTHKGDTRDKSKIPGIKGNVTVCHPTSGKKSRPIVFTAKDFTTVVMWIPRKLELPGDGDGEDVEQLDLFDDLAADGRVQIQMQCMERGQFFGAARADVYFKAGDASFEWNFAKGYLGIWLQMLVVITAGVMFSTFLSGPVALIGTLGILVCGACYPFIVDLAAGAVPGGGPAEALDRLIAQQNVTSPLEPGLKTTVLKMVDVVVQKGLWMATKMLPDFGRLNFGDNVAYGFNIPANMMLQGALRALAFSLPMFIAGYFFLRIREVAR